MSLSIKRNRMVFEGSQLQKQTQLTISADTTISADDSQEMVYWTFNAVDDEVRHVQAQFRFRNNGAANSTPQGFTLVTHCADGTQYGIDFTVRETEGSPDTILEGAAHRGCESPITRIEMRMNSSSSAAYTVKGGSVFSAGIICNEGVTDSQSVP